jgi:hypothetical protein
MAGSPPMASPTENDARVAPSRRPQRARGGLSILDEELIWELQDEIIGGPSPRKSHKINEPASGKLGGRNGAAVKPAAQVQASDKKERPSRKRRRSAPETLAEDSSMSSLWDTTPESSELDLDDENAATAWAVSRCSLFTRWRVFATSILHCMPRFLHPIRLLSLLLYILSVFSLIFADYMRAYPFHRFFLLNLVCCSAVSTPHV